MRGEELGNLIRISALRGQITRPGPVEIKQLIPQLSIQDRCLVAVDGSSVEQPVEDPHGRAPAGLWLFRQMAVLPGADVDVVGMLQRSVEGWGGEVL